MSVHVLIYTKPICPFCNQAKLLLKNKGIVDIQEIDITNNEEEKLKMISISGGRKTVPQIFINNHHIGGFDDLSKINSSGELDKLLT